MPTDGCTCLLLEARVAGGEWKSITGGMGRQIVPSGVSHVRRTLQVRRTCNRNLLSAGCAHYPPAGFNPRRGRGVARGQKVIRSARCIYPPIVSNNTQTTMIREKTKNATPNDNISPQHAPSCSLIAHSPVMTIDLSQSHLLTPSLIHPRISAGRFCSVVRCPRR